MGNPKQSQDLAQDLIPAPEWRYSEILATAVALYQRGLNVIPLQWGTKTPYLLQPFFWGRLHLCSPACKKEHYPAFRELFQGRKNLGLVCGHTSGNLVAIDCDTKQAFRAVGAELARRDIPYWAYTTHRGGVYLLRLAEGEADNTKATIDGAEIWGRMHYVVVPPSLHPSGEFYQWATRNPINLPPYEGPPVVSATALEWLGVTLYRPKPKSLLKAEKEALDLGLPSWTAYLSRPNRLILAKALAGGYEVGERNTAITKPVYDIAALIDQGLITEAQALPLLTKAAEATGYEQDHPGHIRQMLKSALRKANLEPAKNGGDPLAGVLAFAGRFDWKGTFGRTAHTTRAVFLACVQRARMDTSPNDFRGSVRELAELAGVGSVETVLKALKRLQAHGLLKRTSIDPSGANRWAWGDTVNEFLGGQNWNTISTSGNSVPLLATPEIDTAETRAEVAAMARVTLPATPAQADVFARLGRVAWLVYQYLLRHPERSKAAIARALEVSRASVRRALARLEAHGLVVWSAAECLWYAEPLQDDRLERIAAALGRDRWGREALGATNRRKRRHEVERGIRLNRLVLAAIRRKERRRKVRRLVAKRPGIELSHRGEMQAVESVGGEHGAAQPDAGPGS